MPNPPHHLTPSQNRTHRADVKYPTPPSRGVHSAEERAYWTCLVRTENGGVERVQRVESVKQRERESAGRIGVAWSCSGGVHGAGGEGPERGGRGVCGEWMCVKEGSEDSG
jgi:hypothetical protein